MENPPVDYPRLTAGMVALTGAFVVFTERMGELARQLMLGAIHPVTTPPYKRNKPRY